jgi:Domain of unknown function (DUF4282)
MNAGFGNRKGAKVAVLITGFLSFDKLIGAALVRLVYFVGLAGIALGTVVAMFSGFGAGFFAGLGTLILAPIGGAVGLLFWRFACELYIVLFKIGADIADMRASMLHQPQAAPLAPPPAA